MNIKNLKKDINTSLYKLGEKFVKLNQLRELEEIEKNKFIAFVDDKADSFDVMILLDDNLNIIGHECDCNETDIFCMHKAALAISINSGSKPASKAIASKVKARKKDELRDFLDGLTEVQIREWLYTKAKSNKEFLFQLKSEFEVPIVTLDKEEILKSTTTYFKAVMKNGKYYDNTQILKIIELWRPYHHSVIDNIVNHNLDKTKLALIDGMYENIESYIDMSKRQNNKVANYLASLGDYLELKFFNLSNSLQREMLLQGINLLDNSKITSDVFANLTIKNLDKLDLEKDRVPIVQLIKIFCTSRRINFTNSLIDKLEQMGVLAGFIGHFEVDRFYQSVAAYIIEKMIQIGDLDSAEKQCKKLMSASRSIEVNLPYYEQLKVIYQKTGDEKALLEIIKTTLSFAPNAKDFFYAKNKLNKVDFVNLEKKVKAKLASDFYGINKFMFNYNVAVLESDYNAILDCVSKTIAFDNFMPYIDDLVLHNKEKLLIRLLKMEDFARYSRTFTKEDKANWVKVMDKHYTKEEVKEIYNVLVRNSTIPYVIESWLNE